MEITYKTLYTIIREFAEENGSKRLFFTDDRCYSAEEFKNAVAGLAGVFVENSIKKGDMVSFRATRSIDTAVIFFALEAVGAVAVMMDPHRKAAELPEYLQLPVKAFITNEQAEGGISAEGNWKLLVNDREIDLAIGDGKAKTEFEEPENILYDPAIIIFTSGSTGGQKAVTLSQFNVVNHAHNYGYGGCYRESDISAELLPIFHVFGLAVLLTGLIHRYEVYFPQEVNAQSVAESIIKNKMTRLDGVPSLLLAVAKYFAENRIPSESLRIGVIGGAVISAEQFAFIEKTLNLKLVPVYGMSECIGITGIPEDEEDEDRRLTVGRFLPLNQGCILDDNGEKLPDGKIGEVCVKSPVVMLGYFDKGQLLRNQIDENGFLHSGDLGYVDEKGLVHISGRKKDIIIRNGNNLSSQDIANKLLTIEGVTDVCVVGITDEAAGEVPVALVVTKDRELFEKEHLNVLNHLERLAKFRFVESIPLTSSGKPDKVAVKQSFK